MKALAHPFFETLYIDPVEGLYWEEKRHIAGHSVTLSLSIEQAKQATPHAIEFAVCVLADVVALDTLAQAALANNLAKQPNGACARFRQTCVVPVEGSVLSSSLATGHPQVITSSNFLSFLHLTLAAVYPMEPVAPIVFEYALAPTLGRGSLEVVFSRQGHVADILFTAMRHHDT